MVVSHDSPNLEATTVKPNRRRLSDYILYLFIFLPRATTGLASWLDAMRCVVGGSSPCVMASDAGHPKNASMEVIVMESYPVPRINLEGTSSGCFPSDTDPATWKLSHSSWTTLWVC